MTVTRYNDRINFNTGTWGVSYGARLEKDVNLTSISTIEVRFTCHQSMSGFGLDTFKVVNGAVGECDGSRSDYHYAMDWNAGDYVWTLNVSNLSGPHRVRIVVSNPRNVDITQVIFY